MRKNIIILMIGIFLSATSIAYAYTFTSYPGECSAEGDGRLTELNNSGELTYSACTNPAGTTPVDGWDIFTNNCNSAKPGCGDAYCSTATGDATATAPPNNMCVTGRTGGPDPILVDNVWRWHCKGPEHTAECSNRKLYTTLAICRDRKSSNEICLAVAGGYRKYYDTGAKCGADRDGNPNATCENAGSVNGNTVYKLCYTAHSLTCGAPFPSCSANFTVSSSTENADGSKDVKFLISYLGVKTIVFDPGNGDPTKTITSSGQIVGPYRYSYIEAVGASQTEYTAKITYETIRADGTYYKEDCGSEKIIAITVGLPACSVTGLSANPSVFTNVASGTTAFSSTGTNVYQWRDMIFGDGQSSSNIINGQPSGFSAQYSHTYYVTENVSSKNFTAQITGVNSDGSVCGNSPANVAITFNSIPPSVSCEISPISGQSPFNVKAVVKNPTGGVIAPFYLNFDGKGDKLATLNTYLFGTVTSKSGRDFSVVAKGTLPTGGTTQATCTGKVGVPNEASGGEVAP
jgi:hypothetical protein